VVGKKRAICRYEAYLYAPTKQHANAALNDFAGKWESKNSYEIASWQNNWDELTEFESPLEIRKIYNTV